MDTILTGSYAIGLFKRVIARPFLSSCWRFHAIAALAKRRCKPAAAWLVLVRFKRYKRDMRPADESLFFNPAQARREAIRARQAALQARLSTISTFITISYECDQRGDRANGGWLRSRAGEALAEIRHAVSTRDQLPPLVKPLILSRCDHLEQLLIEAKKGHLPQL